MDRKENTFSFYYFFTLFTFLYSQENSEKYDELLGARLVLFIHV